MDCPDCGATRTRVIDTNSSDDGRAVRRRRECQRCSFRFTTYERTQWDALQVKKRDGSIEPYDQEKIRRGIERAVEKRPVDEGTVSELVEHVDGRVQAQDTRIIATSLIGDLVSEQLQDIDQVAYIRFVSVYKAFSDPEEFLAELDALLEGTLQQADRPVDHDS